MTDQPQPAMQPAMPQMPPTPRDMSNPTMSELVPLTSKKINVWKSGILVPAVVTAAVCTLMFSVTDFKLTMDIIGFYLLFIMFYAVYIYSGVKAPLYIYILPLVLVYYQLETFVFSIYAILFRNILPGGELPDSAGFIATFINMFFGAGLIEELTKAVPALLGLIFGLRAASGKPIRIPLLRDYKVTSPLEGMLIGFAAGAAFIYLETLFEYVPRVMRQAGGGGIGVANGFWLLFPRTLQGITGHMGWAAISGYFIGMAARYPRYKWKMLLIGWLVPSVLHAFWNSSSAFGQFGHWVSSALSLIIFVGCILKAKQLEAMHGGATFMPSQSILAGTPEVSGVPSTVSPQVVEQHATSWGGLAHVLSAFMPGSGPIPAVAMPVATGAVAPTAAYVPQPQPAYVPQPAPMSPSPMGAAPAPVTPLSPSPAAAMPRFALACGAARFGIVAGQTIDLAMLFPTAGLPQGSLAEVAVNPHDPLQMGLKNLTSFDWVATTSTGSQATVLKGRNLKLVADEKIMVGSVEIIVQAV